MFNSPEPSAEMLDTEGALVGRHLLVRVESKLRTRGWCLVRVQGVPESASTRIVVPAGRGKTKRVKPNYTVTRLDDGSRVHLRLTRDNCARPFAPSGVGSWLLLEVTMRPRS